MLFGLIGNPVSHSKSPSFFNSYFKENNLNHRYEAFRLDDIMQLEHIISVNEDLVGLNVTSPFKQKVINYMEFLSDEASDLNAVNVIRIERAKDNGFRLYGYNTDCLALFQIFMNMNIDKNKHVIILGTGGAARAVSWALNKLSIKNIFVSRNECAEIDDTIGYKDLDYNFIDNASMIVNATPLGLDGISFPNIDYSLLSPNHICFDLNYSPAFTPFLQKSSQIGASTMNGYEMFERQAMKSWEIWNRKTTD